MKTCKVGLSLLLLFVVATIVSCSSSTASRDVADSIRKSLDQAGFKDVTVSQDREKGVVTLGGHVATEADKVQAESLARTIAGEQVVANQIAVAPPGGESEAKAWQVLGNLYLGEFYAGTGQRQKALETLETTQQMIQEMGMMGYWLARTEKALEKLKN